MNTIRSLCAVTFLLSFALAAQIASAQTTQIPAGTSQAIGPAKTPTAPNTPQGKILQNALTPETRQTLKAAMDSETTPPR